MMIERRFWASLLLLTASGQLLAEHVCVPGVEGRWNCGDAASPPQASALPVPTARPATPVPPMLLIDPKRFDVDRNTPAPPPATLSAQPQSIPPPATAVPPTSLAPPPAPQPAPPPVVTPDPPVTAVADGEFARLEPELYTLQLAAAATPAGFPALLARLGKHGLPSWQVEVQRGDQRLWLLCLGSFNDRDSARAGIPAGAAGAFPKPIGQIQAEQIGD